MNNERRIIFANNTQKVLWEFEYCGQFSDGFWENSTIPYKPWTRAIASIDPENIGTDVPNYERRYTLDSNELLNVIGYRMLAMARFEYMFPGKIDYDISILIDQMIEVSYDDENRDYRNVQVADLDKFYHVVIPKFSNSYQKTVRERIIKITSEGVTLKMIYDALTSKDYSVKMYRKDILQMDKILRTKLAS